MADKLDMSLDDIIKQTRGGGRGRGRGRGRGSAPGASRGRSLGGVRRGGVQQRNRNNSFGNTARSVPRNTADRWTHDMYDGSGGGRTGPQTRNFRGAGGGGMGGGLGKLLISNLDFGVSDSDIKELFSEFGKLRRAEVHYDKSGRSLGTADVIFDTRTDGVKAMKQYNGVPLDGRAMKIQMVDGGGGGAMQAQGNTFNEGRQPRTFTPRGGRSFGGRGRGMVRGRGRGRGRGGRGDNVKTPTAEELDAQLDAYNAQMETD